jgi:phosphate starvation-inducible membrane PsiE
VLDIVTLALHFGDKKKGSSECTKVLHIFVYLEFEALTAIRGVHLPIYFLILISLKSANFIKALFYY